MIFLGAPLAAGHGQNDKWSDEVMQVFPLGGKGALMEGQHPPRRDVGEVLASPLLGVGGQLKDEAVRGLPRKCSATQY